MLNADYTDIGYNYNNTPTAFKPLIANTNITFCKAVEKTSTVLFGRTGIDRVNASDYGFKTLSIGWVIHILITPSNLPLRGTLPNI